MKREEAHSEETGIHKMKSKTCVDLRNELTWSEEMRIQKVKTQACNEEEGIYKVYRQMHLEGGHTLSLSLSLSHTHTHTHTYVTHEETGIQ
jgi:hypothetical protein